MTPSVQMELEEYVMGVLAGEMHRYNDFEASPLAIEPLDAAVKDGAVRVSLPACAVAAITVEA